LWLAALSKSVTAGGVITASRPHLARKSRRAALVAASAPSLSVDASHDWRFSVVIG